MARDLDPIELTLTEKQISRIRQGIVIMALITIASIVLVMPVFILLGAGFIVTLVLPLTRKPYLRLDKDGMHIHSAYGPHRDVPWNDILDFEIKARNILYYLRGEKRPASFRAPWFGMAPTPLLAQLETFRRRYGNRPASEGNRLASED